MRLILKLNIGNNAVETYGDMAALMTQVSERMSWLAGHDSPEDGDSAPIIDKNGNKVGGWEIKE